MMEKSESAEKNVFEMFEDMTKRLISDVVEKNGDLSGINPELLHEIRENIRFLH